MSSYLNQDNSTTGGVRVESAEGTKATYSAATIGLVPAAAATDIFTLTNPVGSTKVLRVNHLQVSGIATAGAAVIFVILKRSTVNTAGTATQPTVVPYDSIDPIATGVVNAYTANPTLGTLVGNIHTDYVGIGTSASINIQENEYNFGTRNNKCVVLRPGQVLSVNYNGATPGAGTLLNIDITWTEENSTAQNI